MLVLIVVGVVPTARADVIGALPIIDCPRGAYASASGGGHGAFAYCAPALAVRDAACVEGRRTEVVGLDIGSRHVSPEWDGRRGPMPAEVAALGRDVVVVNGACEPAADAPVLDGGDVPEPSGPPGLAPPTPLLPVGCQRVLVWIDDPTHTCSAAPAPAPSTAPSPSTSPSPTPSTCACLVATPAPRPPLAGTLAAVAALAVRRLSRRWTRARSAAPG